MKMNMIIGYLKGSSVEGYLTNIPKLKANLTFLNKLAKYPDLCRDYVKLQAKGRLKEYSLDLDKIPMTVKKIIFFDGKSWEVDDVAHRRRVIRELDPERNLSPEERKILNQIKKQSK